LYTADVIIEMAVSVLLILNLPDNQQNFD